MTKNIFLAVAGMCLLASCQTLAPSIPMPIEIPPSQMSNYCEICYAMGVLQSKNFARKKVITASKHHAPHPLEPTRAVDGIQTTRWSSGPTKTKEWLKIDLSEIKTFNRLTIWFETAYARDVTLEVSDNNELWIELKSAKTTEGRNVIEFEPTTARYMKIVLDNPATAWGYSIWEIELANVQSRQQ